MEGAKVRMSDRRLLPLLPDDLADPADQVGEPACLESFHALTAQRLAFDQLPAKDDLSDPGHCVYSGQSIPVTITLGSNPT